MEAPRRIMIVDLSRWFGGSNARALGLLQAMPADQALLAVLEGSEVQTEAERMGLTVCPVGHHKLEWGIRQNLVRLIREHDIQVVDAQNPQSKFWSSLAARKESCALVSTLNSWYAAEYNQSLRGKLYQGMERWTSKRTDQFIVVAEGIRDHLLADGCPAGKVALVPNAVTIDADSINGTAAWLRESFSLPADAVVCVAVGRLVWAKGYDYLIQALAASREPKLHVVIVGEGRAREQLTELIGQHGLESRLILAGHRDHDETLRIVKAADLFVMPSLSEGTPISLLEAGALGKPIVASQVGGIPSLVTDGAQARLVPPGQVQALADALDELIASPSLATSLGHAAQAHVRQRFSARQQAEQTLAAYAIACQHRKGSKST